jgi:aminopeptidase N
MLDSYFDGLMTLRLKAVDEVINSVTLHMVHLIADSAFAGDYPATFDRDDSTITVALDSPLYAGDTISVTIYYHDYTTNRGYYYYERDAYTMAEPSDARWWFPCFDEPWDKATSEIIATVPEDYDVGSNGYLESVIHDEQSHTRTFHWVNDYPITTYLMNLIMADYAVWEDFYYLNIADSIPILNMVYAEDSSDAVYDFENIPAMMEIFSDIFYPYPYNKYGQGAVYPYQFGGMEHQTMTTIHRDWITGDRAVEGGISHELAHMWWGDFVTMSDWRHIWLNEGFATYSSALFNEVFYSHERFLEDLEDYRQAYLYDVEHWGHYPLYDPDYLFNIPEYVKGAWVLHMLRGIVGDYAFFGGLHYYASLYGNGNASTEDLCGAMEHISGMELYWFFEQWIYGQAHPIYQYAWYHNGDDPYAVHLEIQQVQTAAPPFRMPITIRIEGEGESCDFLVINEEEYQTYDLVVNFVPEELVVDPDNWILKEIEQVTGIVGEESEPLPITAGLSNLYPNPFNGSINISFYVDGSSQDVNVSVYDISGRLVRTIADGYYSVGNYSIQFDAASGTGGAIASGVYVVVLNSKFGISSSRITYIK